MKKIVSTTALIALLGSASIAIPTLATAQGATPRVQFCKDFGEEFGFTTVGDCVGFIRSNAIRVCKRLENIPGVYEQQGFRNRGDCVSAIRRLQNG